MGRVKRADDRGIADPVTHEPAGKIKRAVRLQEAAPQIVILRKRIVSAVEPSELARNVRTKHHRCVKKWIGER